MIFRSFASVFSSLNVETRVFLNLGGDKMLYICESACFINVLYIVGEDDSLICTM